MTAITFTARNIPDAAKVVTQCAVLPVFTRKSLSDAATQLDSASGGGIGAVLALLIVGMIAGAYMCTKRRSSRKARSKKEDADVTYGVDRPASQQHANRARCHELEPRDGALRRSGEEQLS